MFLRLGAIALAGAAFVAFLSVDRAANRGSLNGVPIEHDEIIGVPIVVPFAIACTTRAAAGPFSAGSAMRRPSIVTAVGVTGVP